MVSEGFSHNIQDMISTMGNIRQTRKHIVCVADVDAIYIHTNGGLLFVMHLYTI